MDISLGKSKPSSVGIWNNRILRHKSESGDWFGIHEVYYDDDKVPNGWTLEPKAPFGETVEELIEHLKQLLNDAERSKDDVLDYDAEPKGKGW